MDIIGWVAANQHRWQQKGKAAPFFIRDNYQQGDSTKGLDPRITAELEAARMAAAQAAATPQPITDYDNEVQVLRSVAAFYELDLARIEQLRAEGEDKKALRKEIDKQQKLWHNREDDWKKAYREAEDQLQGLRILLVTYQNQESTRDFWQLRDTIIPNWQSSIDSYEPAYGISVGDATKWLKKAKKDIEKLWYKFEGIFKAGNKGTTTPSGVTMKTEYNKDSDVDSTFKEINAKMSKGNRWFENGDLRLGLESSSSGNNGSTWMDGRLDLTQEIKDHVLSALGKIGNEESANITREEAQAVGTFWHEITHNRHITTSDRGYAGKKGSTTRKEMELANEWVARHTLDEFYSTFGVNNVPHPEFMSNRENTGYNQMVTNYDYVIDTLKLDRTKILPAVKSHLFTGDYAKQKDGLINGLMLGGIKKADGRTPTAMEMKSLLIKIRDTKTGAWDDKLKRNRSKDEEINKWLKDNGFI